MQYHNYLVGKGRGTQLNCAFNKCMALWRAVYDSSATATKRPLGTTVTTCNSCTKRMGGLGMLHDRAPDCHTVSWSRLHG